MLFQFEPTDLRLILGTVVDEFRSLATEQQLIIQSPLPDDIPEIVLDSARMMQVIRNLLSNAVKFSPPGDTISINLQIKAQTALMTVQDQGPGIPETELHTIFDKFMQSSTTTTGAGGTGLGWQSARRS